MFLIWSVVRLLYTFELQNAKQNLLYIPSFSFWNLEEWLARKDRKSIPSSIEKLFRWFHYSAEKNTKQEKKMFTALQFLRPFCLKEFQNFSIYCNWGKNKGLNLKTCGKNIDGTIKKKWKLFLQYVLFEIWTRYM